MAPTKFVQKCRPTGPTHPPSLVLDIVGITPGDRGHRCKEHMVCCGKVVEEDIVVCLRKERNLVPNFLASKGKTREEIWTASIAAMWDISCRRMHSIAPSTMAFFVR